MQHVGGALDFVEDGRDAAGTRCTSSMCHGPAGLTLHKCGTRSATGLMRSRGIIDAGFVGDRQRVQDGVGRAAHGTVQGEGVVERFGGDDVARRDVALDQLEDQRGGRPPRQGLALGGLRQGRAVAGQRHAQGLHRQFMLLAVNMPEQEPQVGQAIFQLFSSAARRSCRSGMRRRPSKTRDQIDGLAVGSASGGHRPAADEHGGDVQRIAAISMPGTILSQLGMQTMPSKQWASIMVSTQSAISSREGSEILHPRRGPWRCRRPRRWC